MNKTTRNLLVGTAACAGALAAYAFLVEPNWLETTRPKVHLRRLPRQLEGLRIGLVTDLHAGTGRSLSIIRRACRAAMREKPDMIAVTGDFAVDDAPSFRAVLEALSTLRAPLGVYAVPGNHDHIVGIDRWHRELRAAPWIENLTNRSVLKTIDGIRLCIAGVDDYSEGSPSLDSLPPPDLRDFTILLAHDPDQAEHSRREYDSVDLILSGHTHGGQVRLPFLGAIRNPATHDDLYEMGLRRRPWTQVYTSRGVGGHLGVRFLCRPEVAIIELTSAPRPSSRRIEHISGRRMREQ